jgi:hypothetical protein
MHKYIYNKFFFFLATLALFFIASVYITYPLLFHLGDYTTGMGDEFVIAWIHSWIIHALTTNPFSLFNANIYFPYPNTLAYSDIFLTGSIFTYPIVSLLGQPISANNITLISSLTLLGFSLFLLSYYLTRNYFASFLSGLVVIFSPATLGYYIQIQMLEIYWVPLAILFFLLYLHSFKIRFFILSLICFLLQFYNSFLPAYFILFSFIIILLFTWFENKKKFRSYFTKKNFLLVVISLLLMIPGILPYLRISQQFHYTRDLRDSIHFALQPEDLLYPGVNTRLYTILLSDVPTNHYSQNNEFKPGYLGIVFSLLVLLSIVYFFNKRKPVSLYEKTFLTIAITGLILSFGPLLHLNRQTIHHPFPIPLPYALFYYVMPGFEGFRNSQRWEMLFILGIVVFISLIMNTMLKNISLKKQIIFYSLLFIGIVAEFAPMHYISVPQKKDFPKVYSWMATTPANTSFIILPIYNWNMPPFVQQEFYREYYSTVEFRPMVNGYSGFSPPPWQDFIYFMHNTFPKQISIDKTQAMGVNYIIIDTKSYDVEYKTHQSHFNGSAILTKLKNNRSLMFIKTIGDYTVFAIHERK